MKAQFNKLWRILIEKHQQGLFREAAQADSNSLANLGENKPIRVAILMKAATALDCKVEDLSGVSTNTNNAERKRDAQIQESWFEH